MKIKRNVTIKYNNNNKAECSKEAKFINSKNDTDLYKFNNKKYYDIIKIKL